MYLDFAQVTCHVIAHAVMHNYGLQFFLQIFQKRSEIEARSKGQPIENNICE